MEAALGMQIAKALAKKPIDAPERLQDGQPYRQAEDMCRADYTIHQYTIPDQQDRNSHTFPAEGTPHQTWHNGTTVPTQF
jgi:hypothetical protein